MPLPIKIKEALVDSCLTKVHVSITSTTEALETINHSRSNDTKSSAGDKFETSREMLQAEEDRYVTILSKAKTLQQELKALDLNSHEKVRLGSLVFTDRVTYFISVGLGKILLDTKTYYAISPASPIGQLLVGKGEGDSIVFNGMASVIKKIA